MASMHLRGFRHHDPTPWFSAFPPRPLTALSHPSSALHLPYWYRPHRSSTKLPILFIHGLGIGLWPYLPFFRDLASKDPEVGILALEILPASMRITSPLLDRDEMCSAISQILASHGLERVIIVAHSFGTVITAHILRSVAHSPLVAGTLLVDPIPFLLHLPSVAFNFVYRIPRSANEWQLWYFASRDPDIARALSRNFFWAQSVLFVEDLEDCIDAGKNVAVVLSGDDQIVDAPGVWKYLTGENEPQQRWRRPNGGLEVIYLEGLDHATVFDTRQRRKFLLDALDGLCQRTIQSS
jgi:pimeloyl-ACP methyl ester carboxylesterase